MGSSTQPKKKKRKKSRKEKKKIQKEPGVTGNRMGGYYDGAQIEKSVDSSLVI
jgi:hypothetical protein